jgi:hypothetical protein
MKRFTNTRRRKVASFTALFVLLAVTSAAAYFLVLASGEGSGSKTLGKATNTEKITLQAIWSNGLKPGEGSQIKVEAMNKTKAATDIKKMAITPTIDATHAAAGCQASWFTVTQSGGLLTTGLATPVSVPVGSSWQSLGIAEPELAFTETGTNQSTCEGAEITLSMTSTP